MENVGSTFKTRIKFENFSVVFEELLLRINLPTTELFFEVLFHQGVFFRHPFLVDFRGPLIVLVRFCWSLWLS